jgi:SAM-dependent methyltransferase
MTVPLIFSPSRRKARTRRHMQQVAAGADGAEDQFLRAHLAADVADRLDFMRQEPCRALVLGDWPGLMATELAARGFDPHAIAPDALDEERPLPDPSFGLIVSVLSLDTVNDLPGALIHLRRALPAGGLLIANITGAGSLPALRQILLAADGERPAARVHPQIDNQAASALMARAGFNRQVVDSHSLTVTYRSFDRMVADLRAQALTNVLADAPPPFTRASLARARAAFAGMADDDGRVTETIELLTLTGWG